MLLLFFRFDFVSVLIFGSVISAVNVRCSNAQQDVEIDLNTGNLINNDKMKNNFLDNEWEILRDLFPDTIDSMTKYWEKEPVYLPQESNSQNINENGIRTLVHDSLANRNNRWGSLIDLLDIENYLKNSESLIHGEDFKVLKYLIRDGEEWNGEIPSKSLAFQQIIHLTSGFSKFSLVINQLQKKRAPDGNHYFPKIHKLANQLQRELLPCSVSCNLYLTPTNSSRAFETHIDWMDVIVLQILGEKEWSVYNKQPLYYLATPNLKRKPTNNELKEQYKNGNINNIILKPGDALYIPRGFMHNATTTASPSSSSSLHLTFGIEHLYETTMEALLHNSLHLFVKESSESTPANNVALSPDSCNNPGVSMTFEQFLHYSISEVIQWTDCGGFGEEETSNLKKKQGTNNDNICRLRKSIPLHPYIVQNIKEYSDMEVEKQFQKSLEDVIHRIDIENTLEFILKHHTAQASKGDKLLGTQPYSYPRMPSDMLYHCIPKSLEYLLIPPTPIVSKTNQIDFADFVNEFHVFAKNSFVKAREMVVQS